MIIRRVFRAWQFIAAVALPVWLLVGWGVFGGGGWGLLGLLLVCPIAFVALLIVAGLSSARRSVRESRAVSWLDVAVLTAWHLSIIGVGFYGSTGAAFGVAALVLAIVAFWSAIWQLVAETRRRMSAAFARIEEEGQPQAQRAPQGTFGQSAPVIIVEESRDSGEGATGR